MAEKELAQVCVSVTTLDRGLARRMEPRAATPARRLDTITALSAAGIPTGVMAAPVIPVLNDAELESILEAGREAGADFAGYILLRLPLEIKDLFREWLAEHAPLKAKHVMSLVRSTRGGRDNDPDFGTRMKGTGPYAELIAQRFAKACTRLGLAQGERFQLDTTLFRPPPMAGDQLALF
ncbi:MAG: radical SAM protein [Proteobacteria bacterium]|nr:radical SAM protein [Pseudomonadota bacterium]